MTVMNARNTSTSENAQLKRGELLHAHPWEICRYQLWKGVGRSTGLRYPVSWYCTRLEVRYLLSAGQVYVQRDGTIYGNCSNGHFHSLRKLRVAMKKAGARV